MKAWHLFVIASVMLLAGCASGPRFDSVETKLSPLATSKARIYFYRSGSIGGAIQPEIRLNGEVVGKSEPNGVFFVDRAPGDQEVITGSEVEKKLTFTVNAGETRYVKTSVGLGILVYRIIPELVSEEQAKRDIGELAYTGKLALK